MNTAASGIRRRVAGFAAFAYRTLVLYFFLMSVLAFLFDHGGWINWLIVCSILACPLALAPAYRLARHRKEKA